MTKHEPIRVTRCPVCGDDMPKGGRVRLVFGWEFRTKGERYDRKTTGRFVCRECGEKMARIAGIGIPEEAVA